MTLAIFLSIGESWEDFISKGQDQLLLKNNFAQYETIFDEIFVFSYGMLSKKLSKKTYLIGNPFAIHRYIYWFLLPLINRNILKNVSVFRGMQLTGALPGIIAKIIFRKKLVINYGYDYSSITKTEGKPIRAFLYQLLEKILLRMVNATIVTTKRLQQKLMQQKISNVILIPNSIDTKAFLPNENIKKDIDILFVGRLERQKNLMTLLEAVKNSKKIHSLVFIGSGSQKEQLLDYAKKHSIALTIINSLPHNKLSHYYQRAKLFVLPSTIEGHPKSLLEAMSCGGCVVGNTVEGIRELIVDSKNGFLFTNSISSLRKVLEKLIDDEQLQRKVGERARKMIEEQFDAEVIWQKELRLLINSSDVKR